MRHPVSISVTSIFFCIFLVAVFLFVHFGPPAREIEDRNKAERDSLNAQLIQVRENLEQNFKERDSLLKLIKKGLSGYDSIKRADSIEDIAYRREIRRLRKLTVNQMKNEMDSVFVAELNYLELNDK